MTLTDLIPMDLEDLYWISVFYVLGMGVAVVVGNLILFSAGTGPGSVLTPLVAGIVEPIFSKYLPAVGIVYWVKYFRMDLSNIVRCPPALLGLYGGLIVGVIEFFGKLVTGSGVYAGLDSISLWMIIAVVFHSMYGGLIGNAVFRRPESRSRVWESPQTATAVVILIHVSWNGWILLQVTG